jgi:hypothetical protein
LCTYTSFRYIVAATGKVIEGKFKDGKPVNVPVESKRALLADFRRSKEELLIIKANNEKKIEEIKQKRMSLNLDTL